MVQKPKVLTYIILLVYTFIVLAPCVWMFITAFKTSSELYKNRLGLPEVWHFEHFIIATKMANLPRYFLNTIFMVCIVFIFGVGLGSMAAYGLTRIDFLFRKKLNLFFLAGLMVPIQAVVVPLYRMAANLNALNNLFYLGLVYAAFSLPLIIVIIGGFISQIPEAIEESAVIDGCNRFELFSKIILPLIPEGIISVTVLVGLNVWNGLLLPLLFLSKQNIKTISIGMRSFFADYTSSPTLLIAGCFISMLPILILYAVLQERMIRGLTMGAVKG